jgi:hypothetical protein
VQLPGWSRLDFWQKQEVLHAAASDQGFWPKFHELGKVSANGEAQHVNQSH